MKLIATAAAMVDAMVVALVVVLAPAILPTLGNALLAFCMMCWGKYLTGEGWWRDIPHGIFHTRLLPDVQ
jgi:hypothetical protein